MTYLNAFVAILTALGMTVSAIGWRHSLRRWDGTEPESWFALAKVLYALAIGSRVLLWDVWWGPIMHQKPDAALAMAASFGWTNINILTSAVALMGVYASLKARQLLIPEGERDRWPWWRAWQHPSWRLFRL